MPTSEPNLHERVEAIVDRIRPGIQADGGDVEVVRVTDDGEVVVRLLGACIGCPSSHLTLQAGIERQLRDRIPEVRSVRAEP